MESDRKFITGISALTNRQMQEQRRMNSKVSDIITQPGRKKILAIDGGGTRSCITIEILDQIESMLRNELKKDESFVLSDYFDFFAGTSVGAIISCFLSLGMPVRQIRDTYKEIGAMMFQKNAFLRRWRSRFACENITAGLKEAVGEETLLGTDKLNTLVMLVMRNASTDSPWPIDLVLIAQSCGIFANGKPAEYAVKLIPGNNIVIIIEAG